MDPSGHGCADTALTRRGFSERIGAVDGASYYARRSARDPDWRAAQIADAKERDRRRREKDPDAFLAHRREVTRRYRERLLQDPERRTVLLARRAGKERERRARLAPEERTAESRSAVERRRRRRALLARGLSFDEIHDRIGGDRKTLRHVLRSELASGRVLLAADRYVLNGKLPEDVKRALLSLGLVDDRSLRT